MRIKPRDVINKNYWSVSLRLVSDKLAVIHVINNYVLLTYMHIWVGQ